MGRRSPARRKNNLPDPTLHAIKTGICGMDKFRNRARSYDWTECPFVRPGENARRRDPRKYLYGCVPCPEFRKFSCRNGDACEYAHGVFESWLHPAQYRTRLCKDENGCNRCVFFFVRKPEELRFVNPSGFLRHWDGAPLAEVVVTWALVVGHCYAFDADAAGQVALPMSLSASSGWVGRWPGWASRAT